MKIIEALKQVKDLSKNIGYGGESQFVRAASSQAYLTVAVAHVIQIYVLWVY